MRKAAHVFTRLNRICVYGSTWIYVLCENFVCFKTHNCSCNMWICVCALTLMSRPNYISPPGTHVSFPNQWSSSSFQWTHLPVPPFGWRWWKLRQWEPAPSGGSARCHSGSPGWRCSGSLHATREQACACLHIQAETKCLPFCKPHFQFQMHSLNKSTVLRKISLK